MECPVDVTCSSISMVEFVLVLYLLISSTQHRVTHRPGECSNNNEHKMEFGSGGCIGVSVTLGTWKNRLCSYRKYVEGFWLMADGESFE